MYINKNIVVMVRDENLDTESSYNVRLSNKLVLTCSTEISLSIVVYSAKENERERRKRKGWREALLVILQTTNVTKKCHHFSSLWVAVGHGRSSDVIPHLSRDHHKNPSLHTGKSNM